MSGTYTFSASNTFSESRARHVLEKINADFLALRNRSFPGLSSDHIQRWYNVISYVMLQKALQTVEIQFHAPGKAPCALSYSVISDGTIYVDDNSGRNDFWGFPDSTSISIVISWDHRNAIVGKYFEDLGWGEGNFIEGEGRNHGQYSKSGFGVDIKKKGNW